MAKIIFNFVIFIINCLFFVVNEIDLAIVESENSSFGILKNDITNNSSNNNYSLLLKVLASKSKMLENINLTVLADNRADFKLITISPNRKTKLIATTTKTTVTSNEIKNSKVKQNTTRKVNKKKKKKNFSCKKMLMNNKTSSKFKNSSLFIHSKCLNKSGNFSKNNQQKLTSLANHLFNLTNISCHCVYRRDFNYILCSFTINDENNMYLC